MIAVIVVLGVLVLVLATWLFGTRSALREARGRGDELEQRLEESTHEVERTMGRLAEAESRVEAERARADEERESARAAAKEAETAEAVARAASERALVLERTSVEAPGLWALEALRFDRMWRDHAGLGPDAASPLAETEDPARASLDILAGALREDSGTVMEVCWRAEVVPGPVPAARLVRAGEELFALARRADTGVAQVELDGGGEFVLRVRTEPPLAPPEHVLAALDAAGCRVVVHPGEVEVRVAPPAEAGAGG